MFRCMSSVIVSWKSIECNTTQVTSRKGFFPLIFFPPLCLTLYYVQCNKKKDNQNIKTAAIGL